MVKHSQTIGRQITDELFECVWPFCKLALKRLKTHWNIYGLWRSKPSSIIKLSWSDFSDFLRALFAFAILTNKKHNMGVLDAFNMTCLISNYQEKQPNSNDDNSKIKKTNKAGTKQKSYSFHFLQYKTIISNNREFLQK